MRDDDDFKTLLKMSKYVPKKGKIRVSKENSNYSSNDSVWSFASRLDLIKKPGLVSETFEMACMHEISIFDL